MAKKKKRAAKPTDEGLRVLVALLNSNDAPAFQAELDLLMEPLGADARGFTAEWIEGAWAVREEVTGDVSPIFDARSKTKIESGLKNIIDKVNNLDFKLSWSLWPPDKNVGEFQPSPAYERLGVDQGVLEIGKNKWIVPMFLGLPDSPKVYFYGSIISALQSGQFGHMGRCQLNECRRFFIAPRRGYRYCPNNGRCREASDRQDAAERTRKSRKQRLERKN